MSTNLPAVCPGRGGPGVPSREQDRWGRAGELSWWGLQSHVGKLRLGVEGGQGGHVQGPTEQVLH